MITTGLCDSYKLELLKGIHDFRTDVIKVALYTALADLRPEATTAYSTSNEATGTNWSAGGNIIAVSSGYPKIDTPTRRAVIKFDDLIVNNVTVTFRALLIYNASKASRAILIIDRGVDVVVTSGPLKFRVPSANPFLLGAF